MDTFTQRSSDKLNPMWEYDPKNLTFEVGNIWISVKWFQYLDEFLDWINEHKCVWDQAELTEAGYKADRIICPDEATAIMFKLRWT